MYFSLITAHPGHEREAAYQRTRGPYADHQWLWHFFPAASGTQRDFLFRRMDTNGLPRFYVLSQRPPEAQNGAWQVMTREYAPQITVGTRLQFDLRANPVVTTKVADRTVRHDVIMQEKKRLLAEKGLQRWQEWTSEDKPELHALISQCSQGWLQARAERNGFAVDADSLLVQAYTQHVEKKGKLQFSTVDFTGVLTVTDPEAFRHVVEEGLGHAKAFGCGLLLLRRFS